MTASATDAPVQAAEWSTSTSKAKTEKERNKIFFVNGDESYKQENERGGILAIHRTERTCTCCETTYTSTAERTTARTEGS